MYRRVGSFVGLHSGAVALHCPPCLTHRPRLLSWHALPRLWLMALWKRAASTSQPQKQLERFTPSLFISFNQKSVPNKAGFVRGVWRIAHPSPKSAGYSTLVTLNAVLAALLTRAWWHYIYISKVFPQKNSGLHIQALLLPSPCPIPLLTAGVWACAPQRVRPLNVFSAIWAQNSAST